MAVKWQTRKLKQFALPKGISYGIVQPGKHDPEGVPIIRVSDLMNGKIEVIEPLKVATTIEASYTRTRLEGGEILVSLVGTLGRTAIVPKDKKGWNVARAVGVIKLANPQDAKWIKVCLEQRDLQHEINSKANTTVQHTFNLADLQELEIPFPEERLRKNILCLITPIDDKIELNRQMNRTLEHMARALFKSWFVDFDPVRAKMRGEVPEGMDEDTAVLFPAEMEEVDGREVPRGWKVGSIIDLTHINNETLKKEDVLDKIHYVEISAVSKGDISDITEYAKGNEPSRAKRRLRHGDTVLSTVRPDRQAYFLALKPIDTLIASTGFAVLTPKSTNFWPFVFAAVTQDEVFTLLGRAADGGAYPAIDAAIIGKLEVHMPNQEELFQSFFDLAAPLLSHSNQLRQESAHLAQLRDALLPRLLSGEVDVSAWVDEAGVTVLV